MGATESDTPWEVVLRLIPALQLLPCLRSVHTLSLVPALKLVQNWKFEVGTHVEVSASFEEFQVVSS